MFTGALDDVEKHVFERRRHFGDRCRRGTCGGQRRSQLRGVEPRLVEHGVHCRPEQAGLLHRRHVVEHFHQPHRIAAADFGDRTSREHALDFTGRANRRELAGVDQRDPVAPLGFVQIVGRDQHGDAGLGEIVNQAPELPPRQGIDAAGRLVEEENRRLVKDGAAECQPLAPPAGQVACQRRFPAAQPRHLEHELAPRLDAAAGQPVDAAPEADVLIDGQQLVEREALRHVADTLFHRFRLAADVDAVDERRARRWAQQPAEHADGRRLAGAIAAEEAEDLAALDRERQVVDRDEVAEPPREIADLDGVLRRGRGRASWPAHRAIEPRHREAGVRRRARVRSSSACSRSVCASSTSVLVATPAVKRSPTTRCASCAARMPSSAAAIAAIAESTSRRRCSTSNARWRSKSALRAASARADAAASASSRAMPAAIPERPADVDRGVPGRIPLVRAREDPRVRAGLVVAAGDRRSAAWPAPRRLSRVRARPRCGWPWRAARGAVRARPRATADDGPRQRRVVRHGGRLDVAPAVVADRRGADPPSRPVARLRASIAITCWCARCASALSTSFGGISPWSSRLRRSRRCASSVSSARCTTLRSARR